MRIEDRPPGRLQLLEAGRQLTGFVPRDQDPALRLDGLVVDRGGSRVLDRLDLAVSSGDVVAVQGSSGTGKSTLLAAACGLIRASGGSVSVLGRKVTGESDAIRSAVRLRDFGLVFQGDELLPELNVGENIALPLRLLHGRVTKEDAARVDELVGDLGIRSLQERMPTEVSGGQLQRAAIARALVHRPAIVLADEPTSALDHRAATSAMNSLITIARQHHAAVVVVSHDDEVASRCDRVLVLENGQL